MVCCGPRCASTRRGFLALEGAVFIRYTDVVELVVATAAVIVLRRAMRVSWRTLALWLGSVVAFGVFVLGFNDWAYGHATSTGYSAGEITFSLSAFWPNLKLMPGQLASAVPAYLVAALAALAIVVNWARARRTSPARLGAARRDLTVGVVLAVGWLSMWLLYFTYTWTADMAGGGPGGPGGGGAVTVHLIRFYLPAIGLIALLAAWLFTRVTKLLSWGLLGALVVAALFSFYSMAAAGAGGFPGGGFPGGGFSGGGFPGGSGQRGFPSGGQYQGPPPSGSGFPSAP